MPHTPGHNSNQVNPSNTEVRYVHYKQIDPSDIYEDTPTIVKGVFSNGSGTLLGTSMFTSSISASNKVFYYTIKDAAGAEGVDYFDVAFGHYAGTGSDLSSGDSALRETETIYWQHANIVDDDPRDQLTFADISGSDAGAAEDYFWAVNFKSSKVTLSANSKSDISLLTSKTPKLVIMVFTTPFPVRGKLQLSTIFGAPSFALWSIRTITFFTPATKSIAPPIPLTIFPGIIQLAKSPFLETSKAPSIDKSI